MWELETSPENRIAQEWLEHTKEPDDTDYLYDLQKDMEGENNES